MKPNIGQILMGNSNSTYSLETEALEKKWFIKIFKPKQLLHIIKETSVMRQDSTIPTPLFKSLKYDPFEQIKYE